MRRSAPPHPNQAASLPDAAARRAKPRHVSPSPGPAPDSAGPAPAQAPPRDGDHNQGGARPQGLDYQRDLGTAQDA